MHTTRIKAFYLLIVSKPETDWLRRRNVQNS